VRPALRPTRSAPILAAPGCRPTSAAFCAQFGVGRASTRVQQKCKTRSAPGERVGRSRGEGWFFGRRGYRTPTHRYAVRPLPQAGEGCGQLTLGGLTKMYKFRGTADKPCPRAPRVCASIGRMPTPRFDLAHRLEPAEGQRARRPRYVLKAWPDTTKTRLRASRVGSKRQQAAVLRSARGAAC
jgi:hypothetical protein